MAIIIKQLIIAVFATLLMGSQGVVAHSLVADDSKESGAIIHIAPDDDPVAGEVSSIFIDITSETVSADTHYFSLAVIDTTGFAYPVATSVDGTIVSGYYDFPETGTYIVQLTAVNRDTIEKTVFSLEQETKLNDAIITTAIFTIFLILVIFVGIN